MNDKDLDIRTTALIGGAIGIFVGLAAVQSETPGLGTPLGIIAAALGGMAAGAAVAGARSGSDFKRALLQGKR